MNKPIVHAFHEAGGQEFTDRPHCGSVMTRGDSLTGVREDVTCTRCVPRESRYLSDADLARLERLLKAAVARERRPFEALSSNDGRLLDAVREDLGVLIVDLRQARKERDLARAELAWRPIATVPEFSAVMLYRSGDLYPVVGCKVGESFMLEEGGPEDGEHRSYPLIAHAPTHWRPLPEVPA
jgi:hypothetical protein